MYCHIPNDNFVVCSNAAFSIKDGRVLMVVLSSIMVLEFMQVALEGPMPQRQVS